MRKIVLMLIVAINYTVLFAQTGATCNDAIPETANSTCVYTNYTTTSPEMWFAFTATATDVQISLIGEAFGATAQHIHNISLFEGTCTGLNLIAEDELPFIDIADELLIDASELIAGDTYYLRASQLTIRVEVPCPKCVLGPQPPPAGFTLCIQSIDVFLPLDVSLLSFGYAEIPSLDHVYYSNRGQIVDTDGNPRRDILSYTTGSSPNAYITDNNVSYVFTKADVDTLTYRVDMKLNGANTGVRAFKTGKVSHHLNYYLGHIPTGITKREGYMKIVCNNVYPNIDMQYYSNSEGMKIYFIVHPGGDPKDIEMEYAGATNTSINSLGQLEIETPLGKMVQDFGHTFMIDSLGNISPLLWNAQYKLMGGDRWRFKVKSYPTNLPLIIQIDQGHKVVAAGGPIKNLEHSTFLGGDHDDFGHDVQVDNTGNVYLTGKTASSDFPVTPGVVDTVKEGASFSFDAFVAKFDALGELLWATYYGGDRDETSVSLVVSQDGNIYFAGNTRSADFPTGDNTGGANPYLQTYHADTLHAVGKKSEDGYIVGLNTNGTLYWGTYFGGNTKDLVHKITEDNAGNLMICGEVSYKNTLSPVDIFRIADILCLPPTPPGNNAGFPVCDPGGGAYYDDTFNGVDNTDGYIAKLDNNRQLVYSTLVGGDRDDLVLDLIVDPADGSYYITGSSKGSNVPGSPACGVPTNDKFPTCDPGGGAFYDNDFNGGGFDAFIGKFSSSGTLLWMSYFGSNEDERGYHLALDGNGNLYLVGVGDVVPTTSFTDNPCGVPGNAGFPLCDPGGGAFFKPKTGTDASLDFFISKFDPTGILTWSTYLGGLGAETAVFLNTDDGSISIAIDGDDRVYIFGTSHTSGLTTIDTLELGGFYYQPINAGDTSSPFIRADAYIAAFSGASSKLLWASHLGADDGFGSNGDLGYGITIDKANKQLYATGGTKNQFFPVACPLPPATNPFCDDVIGNLYDAYLARFNIDFILTGIEENSIENAGSFILYPNPTSGNLMLSFDLKQRAEIRVKLYNATGQLLQANQLKGRTGKVNHEMNLEGLPTGIYMVTVDMDNEVVGKKFIKL